MANKRAILLIGGLDPQGCAGITADIQTATMLGCHAVPLLTCLTQQTSQGLSSLGALSETQFMAQYQSCIADFDIAAIKIGLIPNTDIGHCISHIIDQHDVPVILDPVLASTSGGICPDIAVQAIITDCLLSKLTLLTPNLPELAQLVGTKIETAEQVALASQALLSKGLSAGLVKGGHADSAWAADFFVNETASFYCYHEKQLKSVRGTGCILATSLACYLAQGNDIRDAVILAKAYLNKGYRQAQPLGRYHVFQHDDSDLILMDMPKLCYKSELMGQQFQFPSCPQRLGIYPVVDSSDWVAKLLKENITTIQLRIKQGRANHRREEVEKSVGYCDESTAFYVNDDWQLAIEAGAYGVHLGQEDLDDADLVKIEQAGLRLGVSTHSYWELARALAVNPSYIALGPVFETSSKKMPFNPQGVERVEKWTRLLDEHYPLVAIGGIDLNRAKQLKQTGVGSVAMISAITKAKDYKQATQDLIAAW
jgi:hydroxymethylpyrimidine kinase/phosphomethylpyrimidine kinase/thiamine-phosphate diphosphorylase